MQNVPRWLFPVAFVFVGVPFILADAYSTNDQLNALSSDDARQASCRAKADKMLKLSRTDAADLCRCLVHEAKARGIETAYGAYDEDKLKPVLEICVQTELIQ
jgi:hypothetical protein